MRRQTRVGLRGNYMPALTLAFVIGSILTCSTCFASESQADIETPKEGAVSVFRCAFDHDWDENYDNWPDHWSRKTGSEYARYVGIEISDDPTAEAERSLKIDLEGAAACVSSPAIGVMPRFMYKLSTRIRTKDLSNSSAYLSFEFLDSDGNVLQKHTSRPIQSAQEWTMIEIGPLALESKKISRAIVRLDVNSGQLGDLTGQVWLDEVVIYRYPRMSVTTNSPLNVYDRIEDVVVTCSLSGILERDPEIRFQLLDAMSNPLDGTALQLDGRLIVEDSKRASDIVAGSINQPNGYEGTTQWSPPIPGYGSYRVLVRMLSSDQSSGKTDDEREMYRKEIWLAVLPPLSSPAQGEFGWTLPEGDRKFSLEVLEKLLPQVHINWLKMPVWYDPQFPERGDELVQFTEVLAASHIELVGMIDHPPTTVELKEEVRNAPSLAYLLSLDPSIWQPLIDPVMTRLALRIRWWQLGEDSDSGFLTESNTQLRQTINEVRARLFRFGQDVRIGLGWNWESENPTSGEVPWEFEVFSASSQPTPEELGDLLSQRVVRNAPRWVLIEPISRREVASLDDTEAVEFRVKNLIGQIIAAKQYGANKILVPDPFDDEHGLMRSSGTPSELLLPWRTAATMLSAANYIGQLQLPGGSENRVFRRDNGEIVMVLWNSEPTREVMYLGDEVRQVDCWGRTMVPKQNGHRQEITSGPFPTYIVGLHDEITRWRMGTQFEFEEIPSIFIVAQKNTLSLKNTFRQGIGGKLAILIPSLNEMANGEPGVEIPLSQQRSHSWDINPDRGQITLSVDEELDIPVDVTLDGANFGEQPVRIDFEIIGEKPEPYKFSVYRSLNVGLGAIDIKIRSYLDAEGTLVIEQTMVNTGEKQIDFNCYMTAEGHRRQNSHVYRLGPDMDRKIYRFPNGEKLIGTELFLKVLEVDGLRVLKYRFVVEDQGIPTQQTEEQPETL